MEIFNYIFPYKLSTYDQKKLPLNYMGDLNRKGKLKLTTNRVFLITKQYLDISHDYLYIYI